MKKSMTLLASLFLAISTSATFAKNADFDCPGLWIVRDTGSQFTHAYKPNKDEWMLSSEPFNYNDQSWQTHYFAKLSDARSPAEAIMIGQNDYDHSSLMTSPNVAEVGNEIQCWYSPGGANYVVVAVNQVDVGFKIRK